MNKYQRAKSRIIKKFIVYAKHHAGAKISYKDAKRILRRFHNTRVIFARGQSKGLDHYIRHRLRLKKGG